MKSFQVPGYLTPVARWTEPVQVVSAPIVKKDDSGEVKINDNFPGRTPYRMSVEVVSGVRTKVMPDGQTMTFPEVQTKNVTVWSETVITANVGDYVVLDEPMLGAVDGNIYVQALGVKPAIDMAESDHLDALFGGDKDGK